MRRNQESNGGAVRDFWFLVLGDRVVPDLSFVVSVVLLGWVHSAKLSLTYADLNQNIRQINVLMMF